MPNQHSLEELNNIRSLRRIIVQFIEDAHVEEYDYENGDECCDDCSYECEGECSCHEFPGYDEYLARLISNFIKFNFIPKEESNEK